jgi:hypothetical protein
VGTLRSVVWHLTHHTIPQIVMHDGTPDDVSELDRIYNAVRVHLNEDTSQIMKQDYLLELDTQILTETRYDR